MAERDIYDVAIVGLGPVGATLALFLSRRGLTTFVADRSEDIYPLPRAAHVDHEIMRIFQQLGVASEVLDAMVPGTDYQFRNAKGDVLLSFDLGQIQPTGWGSHLIHQPGVEIALRRALEVTNFADIRLGATFKSYQKSEELVTSIWSASDGDFTIQSRYLVGCDGASSAVRERSQIAMEDLEFDEPWLVIDAIIPDVSVLPPMCLQICDPARPTTYAVMGRNRRRWEFMLMPGEVPDAMLSDDVIKALLKPWVKDAKVEIERRAVYRFHALIAQRWRHGRVLIAGDAAHQMPPFAGQGMCSGIRDAAALGWRIPLALKHIAPDTLLDSYQVERHPHVRAITEAAMHVGRVVCTLDPQAADIRDKNMLEARANAAPLPDISSPNIVPGFGLSATPRAGERFIQPVVEVDGARIWMDDFLGEGFRLICETEVKIPDSAQVLGIRVFNLNAREMEPFREALKSWLRTANTPAVLVRPDHYVFGTGEADFLVYALMTALSFKRSGETAAAISAR